MPSIGDDCFARVQMNGVDSHLAETGGDHDTGKAFPEAQDRIAKSGRERAGLPNLLQDLIEFFEEPADLVIEPVSLRPPRETRRFREVEMLESRQCLAGCLQVAIRMQVRDGEKPI